jgi:hypothetical protein
MIATGPCMEPEPFTLHIPARQCVRSSTVLDMPIILLVEDDALL